MTGPVDDTDEVPEGDGSPEGDDGPGSDAGPGGDGSPEGDAGPGGDAGDVAETGLASLRRRLADAAWDRHANPKSGWSRVLTLPVLMYGIYARRPRLVVAALGFTVVNPLLFPPPADDDAWMTRVVLGERMYYRNRDGRRPIDLLNYVNGPASAYAVYAAYRQYPVRTVLFTALSMATKFAFVGHVARFYRDNKDRYPEDVPAFARE